MNQTGTKLFQEYRLGLEVFLARREEEALLWAMELGRLALASDVGLLEIAAVHHQALASLLKEGDGDPAETVARASEFFQECLASFEMAHRGFRESTRLMRDVIQLSAMVSHELRTPLTSIIASGGMLKEELDAAPGSQQDRLLQNIMDGANALRLRTDELLDVIAFQAGALRLKLGEVDLESAMRRLYPNLEAMAKRAGVTLRMELAPDLPLITADPERLGQVVTNLVQNAVKYGADGGAIDVRVRPGEGFVEIAVQDYGRGIPKEKQAQLFQPFVRVDQRVQTIPGLGIGLALCKQIMEAHRGGISVVSEEGKGTTFTVVFPVLGGQRSGRRRRSQ